MRERCARASSGRDALHALEELLVNNEKLGEFQVRLSALFANS